MFTPKGFLTYGGAILLLVGLLGMFGILIGPTPAQSIFGETWYFDPAENIAHTALGVVGLAGAFVLGAGLQRTLVILLGIVGILVAAYNLVNPVLLGANLQVPADTLLHTVVGAWALYAAFKK